MRVLDCNAPFAGLRDCFVSVSLSEIVNDRVCEICGLRAVDCHSGIGLFGGATTTAGLGDLSVPAE